MAKKIMQRYPRLPDSDLLDESKLTQHHIKIPFNKLKEIIISAIETAGKKSSRAILNLSDDATEEDVAETYKKAGWELFKYFIKYYGDPAYTAYQCLNRKCDDVAKEQFRNRTLQKERMNSAWTYQYIAKETASASQRFDSVSDIGLAEADFNVVIKYKRLKSKLSIYVSVKNRSNTMGGQDWPKAIAALEKEAQLDRNRVGDYICVFGISIERGQRTIRKNQKTGSAYSINTELWFSDFFWPFFSNYSYEEIAKLVLEVLIATEKRESDSDEVPQELLYSFHECCREAGLLDENGCFNDAYKLVELFCRKYEKASKRK
ncbi:MAG: hypothetical protein JW969_17460 [Spirochaetales bacterium]|nr:hypothetical protein [Spirochaetales bacterium]